MNQTVLLPLTRAFSAVMLLVLIAVVDDSTAKDKPARALWNTSQVRGTPEPPPPLRAERLFPKIHFKNPTVLTSAPCTSRLFVAEQAGKVFSFRNDPAVAELDLLFDTADLLKQLNQANPDAPVELEGFYGLTFHPQFAENRFCYACYVVRHKARDRGQHPEGSRVVRLTVSDTDPPRCDPASEKLVISWLHGGHNGGCLKFGHDGCLYISTGDGGFAYPPDGLNSGQDVSNLLAAILRIDVDHPDVGRGYSIPRDNPFVELPGARGEIWAYGLRNPWKMSFDRKTGDLWVGDVGWELWELVYRVHRGDNFGWSIVEGRQPVHTERKRGPTPIVPPTIEIPHTDGASVTGGFVYRGKRFPELVGSYVFGDWETRRIWGVVCDGPTLGERRELLEPTVRIVDFAEDADGELLLMDYDDGTIHGLVRNEAAGQNSLFPTRLSDTGLFESTAEHRVAAGVLPFDINAEQWSDHATAQRFLGLPGEAPIHWQPRAEAVPGSMFQRTLDFPKDAVLAKTLSLEMKAGDPSTRRRIETQLLHFDGRFWRGYSYVWNDEQTDATLVPAGGDDRVLDVVDARSPGGKRRQNWHFASRVECIRCHNPWAEHTLAFNIPQLNRDCASAGASIANDANGSAENQLARFRRIGVIEDVVIPSDPNDPYSTEQRPPADVAAAPRLAKPNSPDPFADNDLDRRARAYLHANCGHCHRNGGGGSAYAHLPFDISLADMKALGVRPTQGTFGIHDAEILAPGDPYRSTLFFRMTKLGSGHMPHIGAKIVDEAGVRLIHDWIRQLPVRVEAAAKIEQLISLDEAAIVAGEQKNRPATVWRLAKRIAENDERETVTDADRTTAESQADKQAADRAAARAKQRLELAAELLAAPSSAMMLARAIEQDRLPPSIRGIVLAAARDHEQPPIRDLYEKFLPDDQRVQRLGDAVRAEALLQLSGDAARGERLFFETNGVLCKNCHKIGDRGTELGPDLSAIGKKQTKSQLLDSLLAPSRTIDAKFQLWLLETLDGRVHTGLLVERTADKVTLKDARNQTITVATGNIEALVPQPQSLMPDLLLRDLTAEQVADLLAFLQSRQ